MAYRQGRDSYTSQTPPRRQPQIKRHTKRKTSSRSLQPPSGGLFSAKLVVAVFFIFVFVYIGHSALGFEAHDVDLMIVRMNTIETPRSIPGVIIREERLHYASNSGYIQFLVQENERVGVNTPIVSITNDLNSARVAIEQLSTVESLATNTQALRPGAVDSGVQRLNNDLTNIVGGRIHSFTTLNLSEIYALRDNVNQRISTRNQINTGSAIAAREPLAREYERHTSALDASIRNMYATESGIMSRLIDGHETSLTRDMIGYLTRDDIRAVEDYGIIAPTIEVQEGEPIFKTVGNVWHIATYMPNDMIQNFVVGQTRTIYLRNGNTGFYEPHSLRIERIDDGIRYSLVVFRNTRHVIEFMNQRNISIRTASGVRHGLIVPDTAIVTYRHYRIPLTSIHEDEGDNYVLISTETGTVRLSVNKDDYTEYHAYVTAVPGLTVGSLLVPSDPDGTHILLTDANVRVQNGVYAVVLGTVVFRAINIGEGGLETGYVLLDPALNQGISEFSSIVVNASTVVAGQIIR